MNKIISNFIPSKKLFKGRNFLLTLLFFFSFNIYARELAYLPTYIIGTPPQSITSKDSAPEGISELLAFYVNENYHAENTDFEQLRRYISLQNQPLNRKPSKSFINGICAEFEPDYLVHNEIDFNATPVILTQILNCRGKVIYSSEHKIGKDFFAGMENHAEKGFAFLNPKPKRKGMNFGSSQNEIVFVLDCSGSLTQDTKRLANYISSIAGSPELSIGLVIIRPDSVKVEKPSFDHKAIIATLKNLKFGGEINLEKLGTWLVRARRHLGDSKFPKKKMIILTDAAGGKNPYNFISAIQTFKNMDYDINLITGSFFDHQNFNTYKKAARSTAGELHQITHARRVGTSEGYKSIYLYDRLLFVNDSGLVNFNNVDFDSMERLKDSTVNSLVPFPHPSNMVDIYLKSTKLKSLELGPIESNVDLIVDKIVHSSSAFSNLKTYRKALIQTGKTSVWVYLNEADDDLVGKDVGIKTVFKKDTRSSLGFSNIPEESEVYNSSIPLLLNLSPMEIKYNLNYGLKDTITCFIKGKVVEIK